MTDEGLRRQWRQERRAVVRRLHPDLGGDAAQLRRALDAVDARFAQAQGPPARPHRSSVRRAVRRARRRVGRLARTARASIPAGWPGRRRYFDL